MPTAMKIIRLTAKLLILTAPLMLFSGLLTARPQLLAGASARLMHTAVAPAVFIPLLAIHSIAGIIFLIMRNKNLNKRWIKVAAVSAWSFVFIVFGLLYFAFPSQSAANTDKEVLSADGKAILESKCTKCHDLKPVREKKRSKEEWRAIASIMQKKGAGLTEKETESLIGYLATTK